MIRLAEQKAREKRFESCRRETGHDYRVSYHSATRTRILVRCEHCGKTSRLVDVERAKKASAVGRRCLAIRKREARDSQVRLDAMCYLTPETVY